MTIYIYIEKTRFKILCLSNFIIELFLVEKLLAIIVNISNIDPHWPKTYSKKYDLFMINTYFS